MKQSNLVKIANDVLTGKLTAQDWEYFGEIVNELYRWLFYRSGRGGAPIGGIVQDVSEEKEAAGIILEAVRKVLDPGRYRIDKEKLKKLVKISSEDRKKKISQDITNLCAFLHVVVEPASVGDVRDPNTRVKLRNDVSPTFKPLRDVVARHIQKVKYLRRLARDVYPDIMNELEGNPLNDTVDKKTIHQAWAKYEEWKKTEQPWYPVWEYRKKSSGSTTKRRTKKN